MSNRPHYFRTGGEVPGKVWQIADAMDIGMETMYDGDVLKVEQDSDYESFRDARPGYGEPTVRQALGEEFHSKDEMKRTLEPAAAGSSQETAGAD